MFIAIVIGLVLLYLWLSRDGSSGPSTTTSGGGSGGGGVIGAHPRGRDSLETRTSFSAVRSDYIRKTATMLVIPPHPPGGMRWVEQITERKTVLAVSLSFMLMVAGYSINIDPGNGASVPATKAITENGLGEPIVDDNGKRTGNSF